MSPQCLFRQPPTCYRLRGRTISELEDSERHPAKTLRFQLEHAHLFMSLYLVIRFWVPRDHNPLQGLSAQWEPLMTASTAAIEDRAKIEEGAGDVQIGGIHMPVSKTCSGSNRSRSGGGGACRTDKKRLCLQTGCRALMRLWERNRFFADFRDGLIRCPRARSQRHSSISGDWRSVLPDYWIISTGNKLEISSA